MDIEIKGTNDVLLFRFKEDASFETLLKDLDKLLDQPIFCQDGYFPKAFFDFGCRYLNEHELFCLISLINEKKVVLFQGISTNKEYSTIELNNQNIRNGEEVFVYQKTLFLGTVNKGSTVYCFDDTYFLNHVKGTIILMNDSIKIYGNKFSDVQIIINHHILQNVTTSAFTTIYYSDNEIICMKEEDYDKNHCFNFG